MVVLRVFDPPMCCSTGVCGPKADPVLARFAADLDWLGSQGVAIERFNLVHQPQVFAEDSTVARLLAQVGTDCLPLIFVDGRVVSQGVYPSRDELSSLAITAVRNPTAKDHAAFFNQPLAKEERGGGCCGGSGCCS